MTVATYNLFTTTPSIAAESDTGAVNLGTEFYVSGNVWVTQLRYLVPSSGAGTGSGNERTMRLYSVHSGGRGGTVEIASVAMDASPTAGAWSSYTLPTPYLLTAGTRYRVVVFHPSGKYAASSGYFTAADYTYGPVTVPKTSNASGGFQGSYLYNAAPTFPDETFGGSTYYADVTLTDVDPAGGSPVDASGAAVVVSVGSASGTVKNPASGVAPTVSAGVASPKQRHRPSRSVPVVSAAAGSPSARYQVSGTAIVVSGASGTVSGSGASNAAGTVVVVSSVSGVASTVQDASGVQASVTTSTGSATAVTVRDASGLNSVSSAVSGTASVVHHVTASVPVVSDAFGDPTMTGVAFAEGVAAVTSAAEGMALSFHITEGVAYVVTTAVGTAQAIPPGGYPTIPNVLGLVTAVPSRGLVVATTPTVLSVSVPVITLRGRP